MKRFYFFKKPKVHSIEKILIVKTSSIGDILQAFSVLPFLKRKLPEAKIYWAVEKKWKSLVESHPLIEEAICVDRKEKFLSYKNVRKRPYDLLFDLQGNTKSALVTFFAKSRYKVGFSKGSVKEFPNLLATRLRYFVPLEENIRNQYLFLVSSFWKEKAYFSQEAFPVFLEKREEKDFVENIFSKIPSQKPLLFIAPWSRWENKELSFPFLQAWLQKIAKKYNPFFLFVWGEEKEKRKAEELFQAFSKNSLVLEKSPLFSLKALIERCHGIIASDSSLLHLAALGNTPSFSFFGPTSLEVFAPSRENDEGIQGLCPYRVKFVKQCPFLRSCDTGRCLKDITPEELFKAFSKWYEFVLKNKKN